MMNVSKVILDKLKEKAKEHLLKKGKPNSNAMFLLNFKNYDKYITIPVISNSKPSKLTIPFRFFIILKIIIEIPNVNMQNVFLA